MVARTSGNSPSTIVGYAESSICLKGAEVKGMETSSDPNPKPAVVEAVVGVGHNQTRDPQSMGVYSHHPLVMFTHIIPWSAYSMYAQVA